MMKCQQIHDINCVFQGLCGKGGIFISGFSAASSPSILSELNITAVISIARSGRLPAQAHLKGYLHIPAEDVEDYPIHKHFQATSQFLQKHRKDGNVLVHCMQGISRSASIVAAYLVAKYKYSLPQVLTLLKRKRQKINPNKGFLKQLQNYCKDLGIQNSQLSYKTKRTGCLSNKSFKTGLKKQKQNDMCDLKKDKLDEETNVSKSMEKSKEMRKQIDEKIQKLRQHFMKTGKIKGKSKTSKSKLNWETLQSSNSASLQEHENLGNWVKNNSAHLE